MSYDGIEMLNPSLKKSNKKESKSQWVDSIWTIFCIIIFALFITAGIIGFTSEYWVIK